MVLFILCTRAPVIKPINRFADGCPARRIGEDESSLLDYLDMIPISDYNTLSTKSDLKLSNKLTIIYRKDFFL